MSVLTTMSTGLTRQSSSGGDGDGLSEDQHGGLAPDAEPGLVAANAERAAAAARPDPHGQLVAQVCDGLDAIATTSAEVAIDAAQPDELRTEHAEADREVDVPLTPDMDIG